MAVFIAVQGATVKEIVEVLEGLADTNYNGDCDCTACRALRIRANRLLPDLRQCLEPPKGQGG